MDGYDLIVLGDLTRDEIGGPDAEQRLQDFVSRRGGLMIVIAGERAMPARYSLGALAEILPVTIRPNTPRVGQDRWVTHLSDEEHAITSVLNDAELNQQLWPALPVLHRVQHGVQMKEAAQTLLLARQDDMEIPLVAIAEVGAGHICYLGSDETWRWRDRLGDRVHQTFWLQVMRWGLAGRLRGGDARLQVGLDRSHMEPGVLNRLRARARSQDGSILNVPIHVEITALSGAMQGQDPIERTLIAQRDAEGIQELSLEQLPLGRYQLTIRADHEDLKEIVEERSVIVRQAVGQESVELSSDVGAMARLADAGGGQHGGFADWQQVVDDLTKISNPPASANTTPTISSAPATSSCYSSSVSSSPNGSSVNAKDYHS